MKSAFFLAIFHTHTPVSQCLIFLDPPPTRILHQPPSEFSTKVPLVVKIVALRQPQRVISKGTKEEFMKGGEVSLRPIKL